MDHGKNKSVTLYKSGLKLMLIMLLACNSKSEYPICGTWLIHRVVQNGKDVTAEHNPQNERYLSLKTDSTFESGGRPFGLNTGKYTFDKNRAELFLDSDVGPEDDSYWKLSVQNDTMYWQGYGSEWANEFQIIYYRKKDF